MSRLAQERGWPVGKNPMVLFILAWVPAFAIAAPRRQVRHFLPRKSDK